MAWAFSAEVVDIFIKQYTNGSSSNTYFDANGQFYTCVPLQSNMQPMIPEIAVHQAPVLNTDIGVERAITFVIISLLLVIMGGITSGLNVALLSIDVQKHELMIRSGLTDAEEERKMTKLLPLISDRHLLLVTLLVANASCMEALPIFLDQLVASWLAIVISVTFVLIFGEILPQALFSKEPVNSGYNMYCIIWSMKWLLWPICKPIAAILDCILSDESQERGVVFYQREIQMIMTELTSHGHEDQKKVVEGALQIADATVEKPMIPWDDVTVLDANTKLDTNGLRAIYKTGFSRIPLFEDDKDNIFGILLVKTLIVCDPDPNLTIRQYLERNFGKIPTPALVQPGLPLYDCINIFQDNKTHFAMVCHEEDEIDIRNAWRAGKPIPSEVQWIGIITLEDIMEDIIQEEIVDEFDQQSPIRAYLDAAANSRSLLEREEKWTEDQSFIDSVRSRFSARNRRTVRATLRRRDKQKPASLTASSTHRFGTVPFKFDEHGIPSQLSDDHMFLYTGVAAASRSQPELLSKPLLSNEQQLHLQAENNTSDRPVTTHFMASTPNMPPADEEC